MAVYKGSRYDGALLNIDSNSVLSISFNRTYIEPEESDYIIQVTAGDRLDILAERFYGDSQLQWIILYANPQYDSPLDIKAGDYLVIPNPERLDLNV